MMSLKCVAVKVAKSKMSHNLLSLFKARINSYQHQMSLLFVDCHNCHRYSRRGFVSSFFYPRMRPRTILNCFDLNTLSSKSKQVINVLEHASWDEKIRYEICL